MVIFFFLSKGGRAISPPKQLNLDHHIFVILTGLKAFRLQNQE